MDTVIALYRHPHPSNWRLIEEISDVGTDETPGFIYRHLVFSKLEIDLGQDSKRRMFAYRQEGEEWRKLFGLDNPQHAGALWIVRIPDETCAISSGWFLGLFGPSIRAAGSRETFLRQFEFAPTQYPKEDFDSWIDMALSDPNLL